MDGADGWNHISYNRNFTKVRIDLKLFTKNQQIHKDKTSIAATRITMGDVRFCSNLTAASIRYVKYQVRRI